MINVIERDKVQEMLKAGGQLIEVLPQKQFKRVHLAGAISIPLQKLTAATTGQLDRGRAIIAYCYDFN